MRQLSCMVIGANTGIGFETAVALASSGYKTIIGCRDPEKGKDAVRRIQEKKAGSMVESKVIDLADFNSIRQFAMEIVREISVIDVLVNNAGIMACPHMKTKDGLEMQMGVNHMGHFLLTSLLYPRIKGNKRGGRIVNVSSSAHRHGKGLNLEDINSERDYSRWGAYGRSKLANILFTYELARRIPKEDNVTVNTLHPGVIATELQRHLVPQNPNFILKYILGIFNNLIRTPVEGAQTSIYLAMSPEVEGVTGKYFVDSKEADSITLSYDEALAKGLWDASNELTGAQWMF